MIEWWYILWVCATKEKVSSYGIKPDSPIDIVQLRWDNLIMSQTDLKTELKNIADHLPQSATYADVMYELYVRMKIAKGREAAADGRVASHEDVKRKFAQ
jgi:predicted transcriptional regulator